MGAALVYGVTTVPTVWWEQIALAGAGIALGIAGLGTVLARRLLGYVGLSALVFEGVAALGWLISSSAGWTGPSWILIAAPMWLAPLLAALWFRRRTKPSVPPPATEE